MALTRGLLDVENCWGGMVVLVAARQGQALLKSASQLLAEPGFVKERIKQF